MNNEQVPEGTAGEVSSPHESFEAYEQRYNAGKDAVTSAVADPVEESADPIAEDSETSEETEQDENEDKEGEADKPKKKGGFQRRIDRLHARIKELEAKTLAAKPAGAADEKTESKPAESTTKPKLEDFDSVEEFTDALTDWKFAQKDLERTQSEQQAKAQAEAESLLATWRTGVTDVKKSHADYDAVMEAAKHIEISPAHQRLFLESERGAHVAYELAKDHEALEKFADMSPWAAAKFFGAFEATTTAASSTAQSKTTASTRAPRPPATVGTRGTARSIDPLDEKAATDFEAWENARNAQLARSRSRR